MLNAREPKIVNGPQILDKYVGESEANIRRLFADAEEEEKRVFRRIIVYWNMVFHVTLLGCKYYSTCSLVILIILMQSEALEELFFA